MTTRKPALKILKKFEKLEQRIMLSGDLPVDLLPEDSNQDAQEAQEAISVNDQDIAIPRDIESYEALPDDVLVEFASVGDDQNLAASNFDFFSSLDDIHLTPDVVLNPTDSLLIDENEILTGSGEIDGSLINDGYVSPGNSPGIQTVDDYTQTSSGVLIMEIGGTSAGAGAEVIDNGYDQINVTNRAIFSGTLDIDLINDFTPTAGQIFNLVNYNSHNGSFSNYSGLYAGNGLYFKPVYGLNGLSLEVKELPAGLDLDIENAAVLDSVMNFLIDDNATGPLTFNGGFSVGGQSVTGALSFSRASDGTGFEVALSSGTVSYEVEGYGVKLSNASGVLYLTDNGSAVSLSGELGIIGLPDLTFNGSVDWGFNGISSAVNRTIGGVTIAEMADSALRLEGQLDLSVDNLASLSGDFVFELDGLGSDPRFLIDGSNIASTIGAGSLSWELSGGKLGMILDLDADNNPGYALVASADASGMNLNTTAVVKANTLSKTVQEVITLNGNSHTFDFATSGPIHLVEIPTLDLELEGTLLDSLQMVGDELLALKEDLAPAHDNDGNPIYNSVLSKILPGTDKSVEDLIGVAKLLDLGTHLKSYIQVSEQPHTLTSLMAYLNTNWIPTLAGVGSDALSFGLSETGFVINFEKDVTTTQNVALDLGDAVRDFGLTIDNGLDLDMDVTSRANFAIAVDWEQSKASFELGNLDFALRAHKDDLVASGAFGPLGISLGSNSGEKASVDVNLGGRVYFDSNGAFAVQSLKDDISIDLPVYAELAGANLNLSDTPRILLEGKPLAGTDFTYTTENFDQIGDFSNISVVEMILMFPDFMNALEEVRGSDYFAANIPFAQNSLDQVFNFADGFKTDIYDKINFNRAPVKLLDNLSGSLTAGEKSLTVSGQNFNINLIDKFITFEGVGTAQILEVNGSTLTLSSGFTADLSNAAFYIHEEIEQIQTLQEFVSAINSSGVLPDGLSVSYDMVTQTFVVPLAFSRTFDPATTKLAFDFDLADGVGLDTDALGQISATVNGSMNFFFDLDGLDGSQAEVGIKDVNLSASMSMDVADMEVAAKLGFLDVITGGSGSGSGVHVQVDATGGLDKKAGVAETDTRFSIADIKSGDFMDSLQMSLSSEAWAKLKGLSVEGLGSELPIASGAEIAIYVQNPFDPGSTVQVNQHPALAFDLDTFVGSGAASTNDTVVVMPDLGDEFNFKNLDFGDILAGVRTGIEFIEQALGDHEFYNAIIPVLNFSLADKFNVIDDFAAKLQALEENPNASIGEAEALIEQALGINDNNSLDFQEQQFALRLNGDVLDIHFDYGQTLAELVTFNLDLEQLQKAAGLNIAGLDGIGLLADQVGAGASANILFEGMFDIQVDAGIDFSNIEQPEVFLYDYEEVKIETVTGLDNLNGVNFAHDATEISEDQYNAILADFQAALTAATASGGAATSIRATVMGAYSSSETLLEAGERILALMGLEDRLESDLGVDVFLMAGSHESVADSAAVATTAAFVDLVVKKETAVSADLARGTQATVGFRVDGSDLEMGFDLGPMSLGSKGASVIIDGDGNAATKDDFATIQIQLDQIDLSADPLIDDAIKAALPQDDGRFHFDQEDIRLNVSPVLKGDIEILLPLRMDFNGLEFNLPEPLSIAFNSDFGDNPFGAFFDGLMNADVPDFEFPSTPVLDIATPDIVGFFENLGGSFDLLTLLNDPSMVIDGIDFSLGSLQDVVLEGFGVELPFIGDLLGDFSGFIGDMRVGLLADLKYELSQYGGVIEAMRNVYFEVFGQNGLNILLDSTGDNVIDINDVLVGWYDETGSFMDDWIVNGAPPSGVDAVQFDMDLGGKILGTGIDIPLDLELPGFEFEIDGGFALDMDWSFDFSTGISGKDGFYIVTNDGSDAEFEVDVDVYLDATPDNPNLSTPLNGEAKLGFFKAIFQDKGIQESGAFVASGLYGDFDIDFVGDDRNRLTMNMLAGKPIEKNFVTSFEVDGQLNLGMSLEVDGLAAMPRLVGDLVVDWDYILGQKVQTPTVDILNLGIDVNSLVDDFLKPVLDNVANVLEPFRPVIEGLYESVPGMDFLGIDTVMDLIDTILILRGQQPMNWAFVHAAKAMLDMSAQVEGWSKAGGIITVGHIHNLGTPQMSYEQVLIDMPDSFELQLEGLEKDANGGGSDSEKEVRSGFRFVEYVTDISQWMNVITGGDATLFTYEMPLLQKTASFSVPIVGFKAGPANFGILGYGDFSATADLAFGYDTYGIRKAMHSGNIADAFDGFYVSDVTLPRFEGGSIVAGTGGKEKPELSFDLDMGVKAGVDAGIIEAWLKGGIEFYADFDLQDIATAETTKNADGYITNVNYVSDGKVRLSEMQTMWEYENGGFANMFNADLGANFTTKAEVVLHYLVGSSTVFDKTLLDVELFSAQYKAPIVQPYLAEKNGSTLTLNFGDRAGERKYFNTKDASEYVWLYGENGTVGVEFDGWYQTFDGITEVIVDMGNGEDMLDASRLSGVKLTAHGGAGDDTILVGSGGGAIYGDAGDDTLTVAKGSTGATLDGGAGKDRLTGGAGNDTLIGGSGNDYLSGGAGDDVLAGGTGDDRLYGQAGDDTYRFENNFGQDSVRDTQGATALDFSAMSDSLDVTVGRSGGSAYTQNGDAVRASGAKVEHVFLSQADDNIRVQDFADWALTIQDSGGNDDYHMVMGRAGASMGTGTVHVIDTSGAFDEMIIEQTSLQSDIFLNNQQVLNGREVVTYTDTDIERLSLVGKGASYSDSEINTFGRSVSFDTTANDNISDLGATGLRIIGDDIIMNSQIKAAHVIVDSFDTLEVVERINAHSNGYVDLRTYGNNSHIVQMADILVSSGNNWDGSGAGWLRFVSADGHIANDNGSRILAAGAYLQMAAKDYIGTLDKQLLTQIKDITAITSTLSSGDIVITETDDLNIVTDRQLSSTENPGLRVTSSRGEEYWEDKTGWDNQANADWMQVIQNGRTDYGIEIGAGDLHLTQLLADALLTLQSGDIHALKDGGDITLSVDDIDLLSGEDKVIASGDLTIQAQKTVWDYLIGSAAEGLSGQEQTRGFHTTSMAFGSRDVAAIADGFASITIGRRDSGNTMTIGDLIDRVVPKMTELEAVDNAQLRDHWTFKSDDLKIRGEVNAAAEKLSFIAETLSINSQNIHNPLGLPDSGVTAREVYFDVAEQMHVGGYIIGEDLVDLDVTATTGVNTTGTDAYVSPPNDRTSLFMDVGSKIETLNDESLVDIDLSHGAQVGSIIQIHGENSNIDIDLGSDFLLLEGATIVGREAGADISVAAGGLIAINAGSAVSAGIEFIQVNNKPVAQMTGAGASITLDATNEMLLSGAITTSQGLVLQSGNSSRDNEAFGDPNDPAYLSQYAVYNKQAYIDSIVNLDPSHYLQNHTRGYGMLVGGTITSLGENQSVIISSNQDVLMRGNIFANGQGSSVTLQSDSFVFHEGIVEAEAGISILGGVEIDGTDVNGSDDFGSSIYIHATSTSLTTGDNADIVVRGSKDVDIHGVLLAGGTVGGNGPVWSGVGADLSVEAGSQLRLESGLLASGNVHVKGGTADAGDNDLSVLMTTSSGATARGYQGVGGNVTIEADGNLEMMGTYTAGGSLVQTFDGDGKLLTQHVDWSGTIGSFTVDAQGRAIVGGYTVNKQGQETLTGAFIHSSGNVTIRGGEHASGTGVLITGASEIAAHKEDALIYIDAAQDAEILGLLAAGAQIHQVRDANGTYQGKYIETFGGASQIRIEADHQIRVGVGLQAGKSIDLVGGIDPVEPDAADGSVNHSGKGLVLYGSASLQTWQENSVINLNGAGRVDVLAPAHTNEIEAQGWPINAKGQLTEDVTLELFIDKVSYDIAASVTLSVADTAANENINDLMASLQAALEGVDWTITRSNDASFVVGELYEHFADDPSSADQVDPDLKVKLRNGHINLTGAYNFTVGETSLNADQLGFNVSEGTLASGLYYAIDARKAGSVVNLGSPTGPNDKVYIAGKIIANKAINMFSGPSADGADIELESTGVLETVNGSIEFSAGRHGLLKGDVIARGTGSDIVIGASESMTIRGKIDAENDVILSAGSVENAGELSLKVESTSQIISSGGAGTIQINGVNDVVIDGTIGFGSTDLDEVVLTSQKGDLVIAKASGWVTTDGLLRLEGRNVDIQGVVQSTAGDLDGYEIAIDVDGKVTIQSDVELIGDMLISGKTGVEIFNASVKATGTQSTIDVKSDGDILTSKIAVASDHDVLPDGQLYQQGATLEARDAITMTSGQQLKIGAAVVLGTINNGSQIVLNGRTIDILGSVNAGASTDGVWQGSDAGLTLNATERVNLGGRAIDGDGFMNDKGGNLKSTGDLRINVTGGSDAVGLYQNRLSSIFASSTQEGAMVADATSANIIINTDTGLELHGLLKAEDAASSVNVTTGDLALFDGTVEAGATINISAGDDESGKSVLTTDHVYKQDLASGYFLDDQGRLMDGLGKLVNADGEYVDENGTVVSDPVSGGDPIQLSGATFDTGFGGNISISGVNDVVLGGQIGRPDQAAPGVTTVDVASITVTSGEDVSVTGLVNARDNITFETVQHFAIMPGGIVKTRGTAGEIRIDAEGNVLVSANDADNRGRGRLETADLLHVSGDNIYLDGAVSVSSDADARVLINAHTSAVIRGAVSSSGNVDVRGGVSKDWSDATLMATNVNVANLGQALVQVAGNGSIDAQNDINIVTGGDFAVDSESVKQLGQTALLKPIITTEPVTIQVVTGYQQVEDGFYFVPEVSWVTTTVEEVIGQEEVKAGVSYHTMDVTLTQDGYYNMETNTFREIFVEGVDYFNDDVNWDLTGAEKPTNDKAEPNPKYNPFNTLNDLQKAAVLKHLGYKALYDFDYSNYTKVQVINSNPTKTPVDPDWKNNANVIEYIAVSGWEDKYIRMPQGAALDVLSVVSQGEAEIWHEEVGTYYDTAQVEYKQQHSDHVASTGDYYKETDSDTMAVDRWLVDYYGSGQRWYSVNDGRSGGDAVHHSFVPLWTVDPENTSNAEQDVNGNYIYAHESYDTTTSTITGQHTLKEYQVKVGEAFDKFFNVVLKSDQVYFDFDTEDGAEEEAAWVSGRLINASGSTIDSGSYTRTWPGSGDGGWASMYSQLGTGRLDKDGKIQFSARVWEDDDAYDGSYNSSEDDLFLSDSKTFTIQDFNINSNGTYSFTMTGSSSTQITYKIEVNPEWVKKQDIIEDFHDYRYDWTSKAETLTDTRKTLQYFFKTTTTDIYETRDKTRTYDTQTKVVNEKKITIWRNDPIYEDQTVNRTKRVYDDGGSADFGAFETVALNAGGDISVITGNDISISGLVNAQGSDSTLTLNAQGDVSIDGKLHDGAAAGSVAARSIVDVSGDISVTSGGATTLGDASTLKTQGDLNLASGGETVLEGDIETAGMADVTSGADLTLGGEFKAAQKIELEAVGAITGSVEANLEVASNEGSISLDSATGDILLTDTSLLAQSGISFIAENGRVLHDGGLITTDSISAETKTGFAANANTAKITVYNSGSGDIALVNDGVLNIERMYTQAGSISVENTGHVTATTLRTNGSSDNDDISVQVYGGGLTYNTIAVAQGGLGDVSLRTQAAIENVGDASIIEADELLIHVPGAINVTTKVNAVDLTSYDGGDVNLTDLSANGLRAFSAVVGEGELDVDVAGDIAIQKAHVLSMFRDFNLVSGGKVTALDNGGDLNIITDVLNIQAEGGITGLYTQANEYKRVVTTIGDISFTNKEFADDEVYNLTLTEVTTGDGNVSITSDETIVGHQVQANGTGTTLVLTSTNNNIIVRTPTAVDAGIWASSKLVLDAGKKLDLEVNVDAEDELILRTGETFDLPTTGTYAADRIVIESDETVKMAGDLVFGGESLSIKSGRDIILNGTISSSDGEVVDSLSLTSLAENPQEIVLTDTSLGYIVYHDDNGKRVLERPDGKFVRAEIDGKFVQKGYFVPDDPDQESYLITYLSTNIDGSGELTALDGSTIDPSRVAHVSRDEVDVTAEVDGGLNIEKQIRYYASADIQLDLGTQVFGDVNITAGGPLGTIDLRADQNLDMTNFALQATGAVTVDTTGDLIVRGGAIAGIGDNISEFITLKAGGNLTLEQNLEVQDGLRERNQEWIDVEGKINLISAGTISQAEGLVVKATNLETTSVGTTELNTDVTNLTSTISGDGTLRIIEANDLSVKQANLHNGSIQIATLGALDIVDMSIATDTAGNRVSLSNGEGNITIDRIEIGKTHGDITIYSGGDVVEAEPGDGLFDLIANSVTILIDGDTTDLEIDANSIQVGTPDNLVLEFFGDLVLSGDYVGYVDVIVHGDAFMNGLSAGSNIKIVAQDAIVLQGNNSSNTGQVILSATAITFDQNARLETNQLDMTSASGGIVMSENSSLSVGAGGADLDASGDVVLSDMNVAGNLTVDVTSGTLTQRQGTNLTVSGQADLKAQGDIFVDDMDITGDLNLTSNDGAIRDNSIDPDHRLTVGANVKLTAANGIGLDGLSTKPDDIDLDIAGSLTAYTANGGINISTLSDMMIGADGVKADQGRVLLNSKNGMITGVDGSIIDGTSEDVVLLAQGDIRLSAIQAEGNVYVTSKAGAILDNTASEDANIASTGPIHLKATTGIGVQDGEDLNIDGGVNGETLNGGINLEGTDNLIVLPGSLIALNGDIVLASVNNLGIAGTVEAKAGSVNLTGRSIQQSGVVQVYGLHTIEVNAASGGYYLTGLNKVDGEGEISVVSGGAIALGRIETDGKVSLKAQGSITDALQNRAINIDADDVVLEAGGSIGSANIDAVDVVANTVSALANAGGVSLRFPTGVTVASPGIWSLDGVSNTFIVTDSGTLKHDGKMDRAATRIDGAYIGALGEGSVGAFEAWGNRTPVDDNQIFRISERTREEVLNEVLRQQKQSDGTRDQDLNNRIERDIFKNNQPVLNEFVDGVRQEKILEDLFEEPVNHSETTITNQSNLRQVQSEPTTQGTSEYESLVNRSQRALDENGRQARTTDFENDLQFNDNGERTFRVFDAVQPNPVNGAGGDKGLLNGLIKEILQSVQQDGQEGLLQGLIPDNEQVNLGTPEQNNDIQPKEGLEQSSLDKGDGYIEVAAAE